jgi:hypothetical protein
VKFAGSADFRDLMQRLHGANGLFRQMHVRFLA